jgi:hypothetical protein
MNEAEFLVALKAAIETCELNRYFNIPDSGLDGVNSHYDLAPDLAAIAADRDSPGGIKGSHAQRNMLLVLCTLWDAGPAQQVFGEDFTVLPRIVHSMDKQNRGLLAELIYTYPGWGG